MLDDSKPGVFITFALFLLAMMVGVLLTKVITGLF